MLELREAKRVKESTLTRLWRHLYSEKGRVVLTPCEETQLKRLHYVWSLLVGEILSDRKAVKALQDWCKNEGIEISERTAYDDVSKAKSLFGNPNNSNAIYERKRLSEILLEAMEKAKSSDDLETLAKLTKQYAEINHLGDKHKSIAPRPAIPIMFGSDDATYEDQMRELKEQADRLIADIAEDTDYEDV